MAVQAIDWPAALLPRMAEFQPEVQSRSGGMSMSGSEQITVSDAGRWRATVTVSVRGETSSLALRAFIASMEGRAGTVLVPKWERYRPSDTNGRELSQVLAAKYHGGDFNFDLTGFGQAELSLAELAAPAAAGTTQISINALVGDGPRPGHAFGIGERLYRCQSVWQIEEGEPTQIRFWPRLRAAAPTSAKVILDRPVCLMRFADDNGGQSALSRAGSGQVTFEFVEAI